MNRRDVERIVAEARKRGNRPDLRGADLRGADLRHANLQCADLRGANLQGADLRGADLRYADLRGADLRGADLRGANLRHANLQCANLRGANLRYADLRYADLRGADLQCADLRDANLQCADLQCADLRGANLRGANAEAPCLSMQGLPSGYATLYPTRDGWLLVVGCWGPRSVDDLETLIASDDGWPEATGDEVAVRRPGLALLIGLCRDHIARHEGVVEALAERWPAEAVQ